MKAVVIYRGKHGATKQYAEWLAADLQVPLFSEADFSNDWLDQYDTVIIGGSVYAGSWQMRAWLLKHTAQLKDKKLVFFYSMRYAIQ